MTADRVEQTTLAPRSERQQLARLRVLTSSDARPKLVGPDGEQIEIPESAFQAIRFLIDQMAAGKSVTVVPLGTQLTTQQAADLLHMSRPHLVKLVDTGEIPHERVGTHRRLRIEDVLAFRDLRGERRSDGLRAMSDIAQESTGGYWGTENLEDQP